MPSRMTGPMINAAQGSLPWRPVQDAVELLPTNLREAAQAVVGMQVASIDPDVSDTAAFCRRYGVAAAHSANCVVVSGKREGVMRFAAVMVLATDRADVNGAVRRALNVRKLSFAPLEITQQLTGMEYGGITPVGLPPDWAMLVDTKVLAAGEVVIGGGIRGIKFLIPTDSLIALPGALAVDISIQQVAESQVADSADG